jgi:uncharacterized protein YbjT (DUF2867 family)
VEQPIFITGGTGKTGRRVAKRLAEKGLAIRVGSRSGEPPVDWEDPSTWEAALQGTRAAYISYSSDLAIPGAAVAIASFTRLALDFGCAQAYIAIGQGGRRLS